MSRFWTWTLSIAALLLWSAWVLQVPIIKATSLFWRPEALGQWGDTFGALNALFAAFAFIGVLTTLNMQRAQGALQQKEINRQQVQIERAHAEQQVQAFEATFFQLLELQRELREEVTLPTNAVNPKKGGDAFRYAQSRLNDAILEVTRAQPAVSKSDFARIYTYMIHNQGEDALGPYYRIVYTLLRRTFESEALNEKDKDRYGNLVRSQLGSAEVALLGANGLTKASNDMFDYIKRFRMLKYLPKGTLRTELEKHYPPETFLPRD